jgi:restriction system protein
MARRGFFAELERQSRLVAQQRERAQRTAVREHNAAVRHVEQAQRAAARSRTQLAQASEAQRKRLEKEAREAHIAAMEAEAAERNAVLVEVYDAIDSLLEATLAVDDHVDLETLRKPAEHPPFARSDLEAPIPPPAPIADPPEPQFAQPAPPTGLGVMFGKKKHSEAVAAAEAAYGSAMVRWRAEVDNVDGRRQESAAAHAKAEADRKSKLKDERGRYSADCAAREAEAVESHQALDELIANLGYGTVDAVQEYVSIVLSHSVYPEQFPVTHDFSFDAATAELRLRALVPGPDEVAHVKAYRYTKASDSVTSATLPRKEVKERYARAVYQVALRSIHEVFEADRRGLIKTISIEVGTNIIDKATGKHAYVPFVAVGAERDAFLEFDLSAVVPAATLGYLGAALSKDPYNLAPAETSGVRRA